MSTYLRRLQLQFFADGAAAGDGGDGGAAAAATGVETGAADRGSRSLESLGVPKDKAEKYRARKGSRAATPAESMAQPAEQVAAAEAKPEGQKSKPSWREILKDEEYNREMQSTVNQRLEDYKKRNGNAQADLGAMADMIELLAAKYGIDPDDAGKLDYTALNKAVTEDSSFYKEKAAEMGTDVKTAMRMDQLEKAEARRQKQEQMTLEQQKARNHFDRIQRESAELQKLFPNFDLETELRNPAFVRMTAPDVGIPVESAYRAIHAKEIAQAEAAAVARNVAQSMSNSIQSGQRPRENGTAARGTGPVAQKLYSQMSPAEREQFKAQIRADAARGRKTPLRG